MSATNEPTDLGRRLIEAAGTGALIDMSNCTDRDLHATVLIDLLTGILIPDNGRLRAIKLKGAHITGELDLAHATLGCPLLLSECFFDEPITLTAASAPAIRLTRCKLPGLIADQLHTVGSLELNNMFEVNGQIRLTDAHIGGALNLKGAALRAPDADIYVIDGYTPEAFFLPQLRLPALDAKGLAVDQDMLCDGITVEGELRLVGAHIGGSLSFTDALLNSNSIGMALHADGLTVGHGMFCQRRFVAIGEIRLDLASVRGPLSFNGATLRGPLVLRNLNADALYLTPRERPEGAVDLTGARVGAFYDEEATWPAELRLQDFIYEILKNQDIRVRNRLQWLRLDPGDAQQRHRSLPRRINWLRLQWRKFNPGGYTPQPYNQLSAAYKRAGREDAARRVAIAKQRRHRSDLNPINWLLYLTVGYGYRNWLAGIWLGVLLAVGTWVFGHAYPGHMIPIRAHPPRFNPLVYTLDVLLPIVDLGQQTSWQPNGSAQYWSWVLIGAGWILTTAVVTGLTGILKRD